MSSSGLSGQEVSSSISRGDVANYWKHKDEAFHEIVLAMESVEDKLKWPVDHGPEVEAELDKLWQHLKDGDEMTLRNAGEDILYVMTYMHSGRVTRIVEMLDEMHLDMGEYLVKKAAENIQHDFGRVMIDRITLLHKVEHICRIFSSTRISMVVKALEDLGER